MMNPWMGVWLRTMNTTLKATQEFWAELLWWQTHPTKLGRTPDNQPEEQPEAGRPPAKRAQPKMSVAPNIAQSKETPYDWPVPKAKLVAGAPKFQHPTDPNLTWIGRGRRPRWVTEALAKGRTLDDLRVRRH